MIGFIDVVSIFKDRTKVCSFNWSGNFPSMTLWLNFCKMKLAKISELSSEAGVLSCSVKKEVLANFTKFTG